MKYINVFNEDYIDRILYFRIGDVYMFWWLVALFLIYGIAIFIVDIIDEVIKVKEKYK